MAGNVKISDTKDGIGNTSPLLYIVPQRIQKRRYQDLRNAALKRKLKLADTYRPEVTHIVTEFKTQDQLLRCLKLEKDDLSKNCEMLTMTWFTDSMKAGQPVEIKDRHRLQADTAAKMEESEENTAYVKTDHIADWACQRVTCLQHHNSRFTTALEVVQCHAELRDSEQDYSRALAFRRASCVLKSLPFTVTNMNQIIDLKDLGGHSKKIIKDILEEGASEEVEKIREDDWFQLMKEFTSVFGIGPSTAKRWIEKGWTSVEDARRNIHNFSDWRVVWGLAFHTDLTTEVSRTEADFILSLVTREVQSLLPGAIVELTGGFRRGKPKGHDVDLLITHPVEGEEQGLLGNLLQRLESRDVVLCGNLERSTYTDAAMEKDFKISARGQLDHFEKWLGIIKISKNHNTLQPLSGDAYVDTSLAKGDTSEIKGDLPLSGNLDIDTYASKPKRQKVNPDGQTSLELADSKRDWLARRVDLIICPYSQFFYALVGWTGSKQFNRDLRLYAAKKLDMKLTSHGLFDHARNTSIPASSEKEVFDHLKLEYREPWERNC
ncbi:DNA nucleotidylexotransferase-like [Liolophura sinensis]|uniref:DNA nucleotidylexotransferase-like n=1 Tax=Liolophura sinensis TaxID=3198878 RepID=UPI0031593D2D